MRIEPGATYRIHAWSKGRDVNKNIAWISVDAGWWVKPIMFPHGTWDWTEQTGTFSLDAEVANVRITVSGPAKIWIDDISIEKVAP